ncbi:MAG: major tail protein [Lachnospiraceae bacterium]|nr:major tail protein [Lachnospiraceae bacterium]
MAYVGLRKPYVAKYDRATKTYSKGFKYSHAVSLSITPNYAEASLYGDDMQVEYEKSFTNATISLGTTSTPIDAAEVMFGHTVDKELNKVVFKATDEPNYIGIGVIAPEKVDGASKFVALIIISAKFADSAESFSTKADSLTFNTPTIEGSAVAEDDGRWKITQVFDTDEEATAFVKEFLNIQDEPTTRYSVTQNLTNVTSDFSGDSVEEGEALEITLTEESGYTLSEPEITMGGTDITSAAWIAAENKISIASVTGNVVITASAS